MSRNVPRLIAMLVLGAGLTVLAGCGQSGVVVSATEDQLVIADRSGKHATTYEIAPEAKITLDGRPAELEDLDPGDPVSVGVKKEGETKVATEVAAKSKELAEKPAPALEDRESPFPEELVPPLTDREGAEPGELQESEPTPADGDRRDEAGLARAFTGEVISVDEDLIVLRSGDEEHAFQITESTSVRVAGEEASLDDVHAGQPAVVTAELQEDAMVARIIEVEPT